MNWRLALRKRLGSIGPMSNTAKESVDMAHTREKQLPPIHPGEVLADVLHEAGLTPNAVALALRVPANRIGGILKGQRGITGDTALRLARYFGTSAQMWMNLQSKYDLAVAEDALRKRIEREVLPLSA
jgi:addiction module HigA family antidote